MNILDLNPAKRSEKRKSYAPMRLVQKIQPAGRSIAA
jgi:hypothetical protein